LITEVVVSTAQVALRQLTSSTLTDEQQE